MDELRFAEAAGDWSMMLAPPPPDLAQYISGFCETRGVVNHSFEKLVPTGRAVMMINLGPPQFVVESNTSDTKALYKQAWLTGLFDKPLYTAPQKTSQSWHTHFLIAEFTPLGLSTLLGIDAKDLSNQVVGADAVFGPSVNAIRDRIGEAGDVGERIRLFCQFLREEKKRRARPVSPVAFWAVRRTLARHGNIRIAEMCDHLDISRKHLNQLYGNMVGLSPKSFARLSRFQAVRHALDSPSQDSWVNLAVDRGYFDQAHMHRDFAQYTGETPQDFLSLRTSDGAAIVYDDALEVLR